MDWLRNISVEFLKTIPQVLQKNNPVEGFEKYVEDFGD